MSAETQAVNHEEALLYATMHQHDSNLARAYLALLATIEALREDARRMTTLDSLLEGADFAYGEFANRCVVLLHLPDGVRIGADIRKFADDASRAARPLTETTDDQ